MDLVSEQGIDASNVLVQTKQDTNGSLQVGPFRPPFLLLLLRSSTPTSDAPKPITPPHCQHGDSTPPSLMADRARCKTPSGSGAGHEMLRSLLIERMTAALGRTEPTIAPKQRSPQLVPAPSMASVVVGGGWW
ncbi:hypothetical protein CAOG_010178 [Capsaspora owczarzaki ATCC 30864]|uniref:Uncharacterized protein n=1 Tax=Capsaspora owczarzaki (strain ATCC 30864) TaxID=595528 RepID=A0A0D2UT10_CAPO3|nr:hypothetical protein CAOG_010178 [Capsaspora owczarzaki ATCC 30864]